MKKRLILVGVIAVLLAMAIGTGIGILAAGTAGSADDPLITLSYLNGKFKTDLVKDIDALVKTRSDEITAKINTALAGQTGENAAAADAFKIVTFKNGQTLTLKEGSELLVREGTANITGATLSNTTTGESAQVGAVAVINNMYLAASANSGIIAGSESVKVLVRGSYSIVG